MDKIPSRLAFIFWILKFIGMFLATYVGICIGRGDKSLLYINSMAIGAYYLVYFENIARDFMRIWQWKHRASVSSDIL